MLVKDTTLVSAISVMDLTLIGKLIVERSAASDAFIIIAIFCLPHMSLQHVLPDRRPLGIQWTSFVHIILALSGVAMWRTWRDQHRYV